MQCKVGGAEYPARGPSHSCEAARVNSEDESLMLYLLPPACSDLIGGLDGELQFPEGMGGRETVRKCGVDMHTLQQGPTGKHRELCSILCNNLNGKENRHMCGTPGANVTG